MTPQELPDDSSNEAGVSSHPLGLRPRLIIGSAGLGGLLAGVCVLAIVTLDIGGVSLATGIRLIDSLLYSMGGGLLPIFLLAVLWAVAGAFFGAAAGCVINLVAFFTRRS